ncbi:putative quinol monooxygenase [Arthrobacter halodurans]|uniref:Quinol monooxygenase n=1 Tax=Arthrobacter halodurans TaxID=516699 RepID=A0ABV4UNL4_9MICC
MIFIVVKFKTTPEYTERFLDLVGPFTLATRAEKGNLWFEWSRSVEDPAEFVLVEAFRDGAAEAHVTSEHFAAGLEAMRPALAETPRIVSRQVDGEGWERMGELRIDDQPSA